MKKRGAFLAAGSLVIFGLALPLATHVPQPLVDDLLNDNFNQTAVIERTLAENTAIVKQIRISFPTNLLFPKT